jgi:hypothetical protein
VTGIPYADKLTRPKARTFAREHGYPIIIKPDKGSGAWLTYKINNDRELELFFSAAPGDIDFIAEVFIDGVIFTYDGLIGQNGSILFESSTFYDQSIMDVVNNDDHVHYIGLPQVPEEVKNAGSKIISSFMSRERFFHLELFKSRQSEQLIALEVNMRPPGAWMTDSINYTHDMNIYREWANMVANGKVDGPFIGKYHTGYASRKSHKSYRYDHEAILRHLNGRLLKHSSIEPVFSRAMGNYAYQFRSESLEEVQELISFIQEEIQ